MSTEMLSLNYESNGVCYADSNDIRVAFCAFECVCCCAFEMWELFYEMWVLFYEMWELFYEMWELFYSVGFKSVLISVRYPCTLVSVLTS